MGRLRLGTQDWRRLEISPMDHPTDVQTSLRAVREDPGDPRTPPASPAAHVDASAVLRVVFLEPGPRVPLAHGDRVASSQIDHERLLGNLDDAQTATKRKELTDFLAMLDLVPIDAAVIDRAKSSFAVNVRALDAIHVATAEVLAFDLFSARREGNGQTDARAPRLTGVKRRAVHLARLPIGLPGEAQDPGVVDKPVRMATA